MLNEVRISYFLRWLEHRVAFKIGKVAPNATNPWNPLIWECLVVQK